MISFSFFYGIDRDKHLKLESIVGDKSQICPNLELRLPVGVVLAPASGPEAPAEEAGMETF